MSSIFASLPLIMILFLFGSSQPHRKYIVLTFPLYLKIWIYIQIRFISTFSYLATVRIGPAWSDPEIQLHLALTFYWCAKNFMSFSRCFSDQTSNSANLWKMIEAKNRVEVKGDYVWCFFTDGKAWWSLMWSINELIRKEERFLIIYVHQILVSLPS